MRYYWVAIALLLAAPAAYAVDQRLSVPGIIQPLGGTGRDQLLIPYQSPGPPPACSNSLDFSDGCNSQYIGAI